MRALAAALLLFGAACSHGPLPNEAPPPPPDLAATPRPDPPDLAMTPTGPSCAAQGGVCVPGRWAHCPPGTWPTDDVHADCLPPTDTRGWFCCVPAPPSPCSDRDGEMLDCFADQCHACWGAAPAHTCAGGRVCCAYHCLD